MRLYQVKLPYLPSHESFVMVSQTRLDEKGFTSLDDAEILTFFRPYVSIYVPHSTGSWVGIHRKPMTLVKNLLDTRRNNDIAPDVSVVNDISEQELRIYTDAGRVLRPLFVVERNGRRLMIKKKHIRKLAPLKDYAFTNLLQVCIYRMPVSSR